jgi:chemosensory pili system protein ChpA (sensor histidine kinase/response regulator)
MTRLRSFSGLKWVGNELGEVIRKARNSLEEYVEGSGETLVLKSCVEQLSQVRGVLEMLELTGPRRLADEMQASAKALMDETVANTQEAAEALMLALIQLPDYLERLGSGTDDIPLLLLPTTNDLRVTRGSAPLREADLVLSGLVHSAAANDTQEAPGKDLRQAAREARPCVHRALLGWFRGNQEEEEIGNLRQVFGELEACAGGEPLLRGVFRTVHAITEGLLDRSIESDKAIKGLIGRIDRVVKQLGDQGIEAAVRSIPEDVVKELLHQLALSESDHPAIRQIKADFGLDRVFPSAAELERARTRLLAPGAGALQGMQAAAIKELEPIKDTLDLYMRGSRDDARRLLELDTPILRIAKTLEMAGLPDLGMRLRERAADVQAIGSVASPPENALLMRIAGDLLYVESSLANLAPKGEAGDGGAETATDMPRGEMVDLFRRTLGEAVVELAKAKEAIVAYMDSPTDSRHLEKVPKLFHGIAGALRVIAWPDAGEILDGVGGFVRSVLLRGGEAPNQKVLDALADTITSVEYYMEALSEDRADAPDILQTARDALQRLDAVRSATGVAQPAVPVVQTQSREAEPSEPPDRASSLPTDRIEDPEILEIFLEEAREEEPVIREHYGRWRADPQNHEALVRCRRAFHTLKGSGRLAGATTIGEFSWAMENLLNRVIDQTLVPGPEVLELLDSAVPAVAELIDARAADRSPDLDAAALLRQAHLLVEHRSEIQPVPSPEGIPEAEPVAAQESLEAPEPESPPEGSEAQTESLVVEDSELREIFEDEAQEHLDSLASFVQACRAGSLPCAFREDVVRSLHTLAGSARMAGLEPIARVAKALERRAGALFEQGLGAGERFLSLLEQGVTVMDAMVHSLRAPGVNPPATGALLDAIEAYQTEPDRGIQGADLAPELAAEAAPEAPVAEGPALGQASEPGSADAVPEGLTVVGADAPMERGGVLAGSVVQRPEIELQDLDLVEAPSVARTGRGPAVETAAEEPGIDLAGLESFAAEGGDGESIALPEETDPEAAVIGRDHLNVVEAEAAGGGAEHGVVLPFRPQQATPIGLAGSESFAPEGGEGGRLVLPENEVEPAAVGLDDLDVGEVGQAEEALDLAPTPSRPGGAVSGFGPEGSQRAVSEEVAEEESALSEALEEATSSAAQEPEAQRHAPASGVPEPGTSPAALASGDAVEERYEQISADPEMREIFLEEAEDLLDQLDEGLRAWLQAPGDSELPTRIQRTLHTLKGGARLSGIQSIGDLSHSLETLVSGVGHGTLDATAERVLLAQCTADRLSDQVQAVRQGEPVPLGVAVLEALRIQGRAAAAPGDTAASAGTVPTAEPLAAEEGEKLEADPELLDIFLEEAQDLLDQLDAELREWSEELESRELPGHIKRTLHTLKGSARLAGIRSIGSLGHALETLLDGLTPDKMRSHASLMPLAQRAADRLADQIEAVRGGGPVPRAKELVTELEFVHEELQGPVGEVGIGMPEPPPVQPAPAVQASETPHPAPRDARQGAQVEQVRVRSDLLNRLVNNAGEISIYRARLEQQNTALGFNLGELDQTVARLHNQLRHMEIETEAQILYRYEREREEGKDLEEEFDPLELDRFSTIQQLSRSLIETVNDLVSIRNLLEDQQKEAETLLLQHSRISNDLQDGLLRTRMVPFSQLVPRLHRLVRQTATSLGKRAVLEVFGAEGEMDRSILDRMLAPLEHILRNAVSHGIEAPEERRKAGKSDTGRISIYLTREGNDVVITVSDDGAGLNLASIRKRAEETGLLEKGARIDDDDLMQLILEPGFSTVKQVTQISGRGVGTDVVVSEVKQLGGSLEIGSQPGRGTSFSVHLPFTLAISEALLVGLGDDVFAVPHVTMEGVVRIGVDELQRCYDGLQPGFRYAGHDYLVRYLGNLLSSQQPPLQEGRKWLPLLLVRSGEHRVAIQVDQILGNRQIVVKSVGAQLSNVRWISGGTILADGRVALIMDVSALVRMDLVHSPQADKAGRVAKERPVRVMVVDDSITVRKVTTRLLKRHNMEVLTAKDGVDAVTQLQEQQPDVMLLDVEMPRMDGYELARHMRNSEELSHIPIIMITSRSGEKHRNMALSLGVRRYLGKPYQEADLLDNIFAVLAEVETEA